MTYFRSLLSIPNKRNLGQIPHFVKHLIFNYIKIYPSILRFRSQSFIFSFDKGLFAILLAKL